MRWCVSAVRGVWSVTASAWRRPSCIGCSIATIEAVRIPLSIALLPEGDWAPLNVLLLQQFDHGVGHGLGQKKGAFEIDAHHLVIALFPHGQNIHALTRRHAGIIHQQIHAAKMVQTARCQRLAIRGHAYIGLHGKRLRAFLRDEICRFGRGFRIAAIVDHQRPPFGGQAQRNAAPNAAPGAGDQRHSRLCLTHSPAPC